MLCTQLTSLPCFYSNVFEPEIDLLLCCVTVFGLVSESTLADTPEDDARFQLEEENVLTVIFFFFSFFLQINVPRCKFYLVLYDSVNGLDTTS